MYPGRVLAFVQRCRHRLSPQEVPSTVPSSTSRQDWERRTFQPMRNPEDISKYLQAFQRYSQAQSRACFFSCLPRQTESCVPQHKQTYSSCHLGEHSHLSFRAQSYAPFWHRGQGRAVRKQTLPDCYSTVGCSACPVSTAGSGLEGQLGLCPPSCLLL